MTYRDAIGVEWCDGCGKQIREGLFFWAMAIDQAWETTPCCSPACVEVAVEKKRRPYETRVLRAALTWAEVEVGRE